ncbi:MAG: SusD/RagB family nutrient-binding outer membrane lipoprotein [Bacteroidales bacterium]|nr:SusD/RagB family nutrient-binding outer membrane lipoprotein [Bacteroidales bacterium]
MKNIKIFSGIMILCFLAGIYSCNTERLKSLDNPKYLLTDNQTDLGMVFTNIQVNYTRRSALNALRVPGGYAKYYATHSMIEPGDRYQFDQTHNDDPWSAFSSEAKEAVHLVNVLEAKADPLLVNKIAMAKIMKVSIFSWLTDIFGDIPYTEACLALLEGDLAPAYDKQEDIYKDMLLTLKEACASFDPSVPIWTSQDAIYSGSIPKWKKYGYSLMLRLAMRVAGVDAALAKEYAELAISSGVILDNADNFKINCLDGKNSERNPVAYGMIYNDPEKYWKLGADFVDALKDNDPRAQVILGGKLKPEFAVPNSGIMNTYWFNDAAWNYNLAEQQGYPHGQDVQVTTYELIQKNYTKQSRFLFDYSAPVVRLAAYEMYFLISKAASLGWNTGGRNAEDMYKAGVESNMKFYAQYTGAYKISDAEIAVYLAYRPYSLANLYREMWIGNYMNPFEAWFYIRQWGPDLTPNVNGISMPRRNAYVNAELTRNTENYNKALVQMGMAVGVSNEEQFTHRCWWDVRPN